MPPNTENTCKNGGRMVINLKDGPSSNPYRCQCSHGFTGENCLVRVCK